MALEQHSLEIGGTPGLEQHSLEIGGTPGLEQHSLEIGGTPGLEQLSLEIGGTPGMEQFSLEIHASHVLFGPAQDTYDVTGKPFILNDGGGVQESASTRLAYVNDLRHLRKISGSLVGVSGMVGGHRWPLVSTSADFIMTLTNSIVLMNASGGARTVTLPSAQAMFDFLNNQARMIIVRKTDTTTNVVTVTTPAPESQLIDGAGTFTLDLTTREAAFVSNGTHYWRAW